MECTLDRHCLQLHLDENGNDAGVRKNAERVLRRVAKGERLVLSHRGKPAARLEPVTAPPGAAFPDDPFLGISRRASASPKGKTKHSHIDRILDGGR
jgi:antitoxin (DNA-binding transcriptional repressor) of toxin-antitoxin stability system